MIETSRTYSSSGHEMPMPEHMCKMNMLLSTEFEDICVLSSRWHIYGLRDLLLSCAIIVVFGIGYEFYKSFYSTWSTRILSLNRPLINSDLQQFRVKASILYGIQIFWSLVIMLIFMTFNLWLMLSVVMGAVVGFYLTGSNNISGLACH
ncbi:Putative copper transport protein 2 [Komagataella phaffii CBS 7435]|uniref:Copper transport protein n=2 Tax=Komagataella phaffii TaxID=460519 RepID=C4R1R1_KOMPG|nr:uncharacterized protein PAS_chr2-1_0889 [Komagataella phaffii GS115]AOA62470.1 GQ67_00851T0 [Komagataella phaffii]CAH2448026.1 Putative copper transport protein 2 [Komagataella phaffii CBS 7435]AOA67490.1 GQ68_00538T0 [Komagataella phaffii GS115]CAY69435.1 hypothetical protein PAS_chr2-1_0889 [Komagataella phaffii GS115]CCA38180.1 Putative copper transport protein 2 [Komagataella phaffii CBS 7435]